MKSRGRRRERGLIRSVSFERLADDEKAKGYEVLGPIAQSCTIQGSGQRKRHIVTYRQASWPRAQPPAVQRAYTEDSSLSVELNEFEEESMNDARVIKLTSSETGAYVSRPSTFCNIFETTYQGAKSTTETQECNEHASGRLIFCPEHVDTSPGCDSFGVIGKMVELSFDNWFSYPKMPFLEHTSSSESNSSKEESVFVTQGTAMGEANTQRGTHGYQQTK